MSEFVVQFAVVVEDDPIIMMDAVCILEDAGFSVHEAFDGDEAIVLLGEHWGSTTLLFSDVDMPGSVNGFALARHVDKHWPSIEIVIASGHVLPAENDMPERATFVAKPFNRRMIHEHLVQILPDHKKPDVLKDVCRARKPWF